MPIGSGTVYNVNDVIISQVSSSGTAFLETKLAAATSSLIYFDSNARINSASLNSITVGTASYFSGNSISSSYSSTSSYSIYAETSSNAQNAQDILLYVKNTSGAIISKGSIVRIKDVENSSYNPTIELADFRYESSSANTVGYANEQFAINGFGYVITEGKLVGVDTSAFSAGDLLYLSSSGQYTNVKPVPPNHGVRVGQVIRSNNTNGSIYVTIDNGAELDELHNVLDTSTTSSYGDLLVKSGSLWINSKNLTGSYTITGSLDITQNISASGTGSFGIVGIGTTSPSAKLHVQGGNLIVSNTNSQLSIFSNYPGSGDLPAGTYIGTNTATNTNLSIIPVTTGIAGSKVVGGAYNGTAWRSMYEYAHVSSGEPNLSLVKTAGNVGIGTTTPSAKLEISSSNDQTVINAGGFNGRHVILPGRIIVGSVSTAYPKITYNAVPSSSAGQWKYAATDTAYAINMGGSNTLSFEYVGLGTSGSTFTTWNTWMTLVSGSNNVGIGVSSPVNKLDVAGNISASAITASLFLGTSSFVSPTGNAFVQGGNSFGTTATLGTNDNNGLTIETSGSRRAFVTNNGKIIIGDSTTADSDLNLRDNKILSLGSSGGYHNIYLQRPLVASSGYHRFHLGTRWYYDETANVWTASAQPNPDNPDWIAIDGPGSYLSFKVGSITGSTTSLTTSSYNDSERLRITTAATILFNSGSDTEFRIVSNDSTNDPKLTFYSSSTALWAVGVDDSDDDKFKINRGSSLATLNVLTINTSSNVGIGTTNPAYLLDVSGSSARINTSDGNGLILGSTKPISLFNYTSYGSNGSQLWAVNQSGVGDVISLALGANFSYAKSVELTYATSSGEFRIGSQGSSAGTHKSINLIVNNTSSVFITGSTSGYSSVGIGNTTPNSFVNANVSYFSPNANSSFLTLYSKNAEASINLVSSGSTNGASVGGIYFTREQGASDAHKQIAAIKAVQNGTSATLAGGKLFFYTKVSGGGTFEVNPQLTIVSSNNSDYSDANVGIGTSSPAYTLHVRNLSKSGSLGIDVDSALGVSNRDGVFTVSPDVVSNTGGFLFKTYNGASVNAVSITPTGNVGIGLTSPVNKLDVVGNISASVITASLFFGTSSWSTNSLTASYLVPTNSYTITNLTSSNISASATGSFGAVNIGTSTLRNQLTVIGPAQATSAVSDSGNGGGTIFVGSSLNAVDQGGTLLFSTINDLGTYLPQWSIKTLFTNGNGNGVSDLAFSSRTTGSATALTEQIRFQSNGYVGIGETSPSYKLTVHNRTNSSDNSDVEVVCGGSGQASLRLFEDNSGNHTTYGARVYYNGSSNTFFNISTIDTVETVRLAIDRYGSVGIGTTNPAYTLDVSGSSRFGYTATDTHQFTGSVSLTDGLSAVNLTASNATINGNLTVTGSIFATLFSGSNIYITSSQLVVTDNILTLNALSPYQRYAGIEMYDSGSGNLSSFLWDGQGDYFFISGSGINGKIISGPDGQLNLTSGRITKATAGNILGDSIIYDLGNGIRVDGFVSASSFTSSVVNAIGFLGTSSWATNSSTASFLPVGTYNITSSWSTNSLTASSLVTTNSYTITNLTASNISASGNGYFNNVGIGTTSPSAKLEVSASSNIPIVNLYRNVASATSPILYSIEANGSPGKTNVALFERLNNLTAANISASSAGIRIREHASNYALSIEDHLNNSYLVIKGGGNVGIGINDPSAKLQVNGNISGSSFTSSISNAVGFLGTASWAVNSSTASFLPSGTYNFTSSWATNSLTASYLTPANSYQITNLTASNISASGTIRAVSLIETSTITAKYNIVPLEDQLEKVTKLNPVSFIYKYNNEPSIGLIAEEVGEIYPEFTTTNKDAVAYSKMVSVLIQSVKELKSIVDDQQKQINELLKK